MKLLIIIVSHDFDVKYINNIVTFKKLFENVPDDIEIDYCGISNGDNFHNYENIITFKYKIINGNKQFTKLCDFITNYYNDLNYDWYVKIRPDIFVIEPIDFRTLSDNAINARARCYTGPKTIKYGMTVNGEGIWKNIGDCHYNDNETYVILDDQIFIFHNNVIKMGAFNREKECNMTNSVLNFFAINLNAINLILKDNLFYRLSNIENEWTMTRELCERNIGLNVIGINVILTKYGTYSGHLNM